MSRASEHVIESLECMKTCLKARALLVSTETTQEAIDTIRRLQTIVDRLPKTGDGVPMLPGDIVFGSWEGEGVVRVICDSPYIEIKQPGGYFTRHASECYSTAEAARKES